MGENYFNSQASIVGLKTKKRDMNCNEEPWASSMKIYGFENCDDYLNYLENYFNSQASIIGLKTNKKEMQNPEELSHNEYKRDMDCNEEPWVSMMDVLGYENCSDFSKYIDNYINS